MTLVSLKDPAGHTYFAYISKGGVAFRSSTYRRVSDSSGVRWVQVNTQI